MTYQSSRYSKVYAPIVYMSRKKRYQKQVFLLKKPKYSHKWVYIFSQLRNLTEHTILRFERDHVLHHFWFQHSLNLKDSHNDENLPSVKQSTQQRGEKGARWKGPSHGKQRILQKGKRTNQVPRTPPIVRIRSGGRKHLRECLT